MKKSTLVILLLLSLPFYVQSQWWVAQNSGVIKTLNDVYAATENFVIVVGDDGTILKTTDGGEHWIQKNSGVTSNLKRVQFLNTTMGYAVGSNGTLLKTIDGGENWNVIDTGVTTDLYGLSCLSDTTFYISGENGLIKKTVNSGVTFTDQSYTEAQTITSVQYLNEQIGYAQGEKLLKTTDGGGSWSAITNDPIDSFHFINENIGFMHSMYLGGGLSKTTNGGQNFVDLGGYYFLVYDMFSLNENIVWAVENNGLLCTCPNFCVTRLASTPENGYQGTANCGLGGDITFNAIHFANETTGYIVGWGGAIYKNGTGSMGDMAVSEFDKNDSITISPNPSSEWITIENKSNATINTVQIYDMNGRKVLEANDGKSTVNISALSKGMYMVTMNSDNGSSTKKLVKK